MGELLAGLADASVTDEEAVRYIFDDPQASIPMARRLRWRESETAPGHFRTYIEVETLLPGDPDDGHDWDASVEDEPLPEGADCADSAPYEQVEDRLLARLGLTRSDLTHETVVFW